MSYVSEEETIFNAGTSMHKGEGDSEEEMPVSSLDKTRNQPHPLCVIDIEDDHVFRLEEESLKEMLLCPEIADKKVLRMNYFLLVQVDDKSSL